MPKKQRNVEGQFGFLYSYYYHKGDIKYTMKFSTISKIPNISTINFRL